MTYHCNKCGYTGDLVDHPGCDYGAQKMTVPTPNRIVITIEGGFVTNVDFSVQYADVLVIDKDVIFENACIEHQCATDTEFQRVHDKVDEAIAEARKDLFPQDYETMSVPPTE